MGLFITLSAASSRWTSTVVQGSGRLSLLPAVCRAQESPFNAARVAVFREQEGSRAEGLVVLVYTPGEDGWVILSEGLLYLSGGEEEKQAVCLKD